MGLTIGVLAGGTPKAIACHPEIIGAHLAVIADVAKELALLTVDPDKVLRLPLSRWGTVAALVEDAKACGLALAPELEALLTRLPNASLEEGMCQVALWGDLAIRVLEAKGLLEELKEQVFERALQIAEGELAVVRIVEGASQAGGTGKGAGHPLAQAVVRTFLERSPATVLWEKVYIGNLTFVGLGKNILPNAVHLESDVAHVLDGDRHARELRELWLAELPLRKSGKPIGTQKEARDALVGTLFQALFSSKVREEVSRRRPNRLAEHPLGALKLVRADFWHPLGEEQLLLAAATYHTGELLALEGKLPPADACKRVAVQLEEHGQWRGGPPEKVVEVVRTAAEKPGFFAQELWDTPHYGGRVVAFFAEDEPVLFDTLLRAPSPSTPQEYLRTRSQYASIQRVLTEELRRERDQQALTETAVTEAKATLQQAIGVLYPEHWWDKAVSFLSALWPWGDDPLVRFERALSGYRRAATAALQSQAKGEALGGAIEQLEAEGARYKGEIDRTVAFLRAFAQGRSRATHLVVFAPLDAVFAELLRVAGAQDQAQLRQVLRRAIGGVTERGLAQIVGATDADLREVLSQLATAPPPYRGPMWGGSAERKPARHRFFVLPPLEGKTREGVLREAAATGLSQHVVEADTLVAGLTVVAVEVYEVERIEEVVTALYAHYGREVLRHERRPLFLLPDRNYPNYEAVRNGTAPAEVLAATARGHEPRFGSSHVVDEAIP